MKRNLIDSLRSYNADIYPMHMPGHKGGRYRLAQDVYPLDVTEVSGTDHLYQPTGILKDSMTLLTQLYQTKKTVFLVNGSTVGILSAMGGIHEAGDEVLVARNCHQSVYNGLTLFRLKPTYIYPKMTRFGLIGGIDPEEVKSILITNPKITTFVMTSPTYDGFISDIKSIVQICHRYNVLLIVDEAHGAHLPFSKALPDSAVELGADIVVHSMHKTLPTFTQSGLLHLNLPSDLEAKVLRMLQMLQTSSPSYVMMAQMDMCVRQLFMQEALWIAHLKTIEAVHNRLKKLEKLHDLNGYVNPSEGIIDSDPYKHVILLKQLSITGHDLNQLLREQYHFQLELSSKIHGLGIFSIADSVSALTKYTKAILKIDKRVSSMPHDKKAFKVSKMAIKELEPHEAFNSHSIKVKLNEGVNGVVATMITPYPPGIPVLVPGEVLTIKVLEQIELWLAEGMDVLGCEDGMIEIVEDLINFRT